MTPYKSKHLKQAKKLGHARSRHLDMRLRVMFLLVWMWRQDAKHNG